MMQKLLITLAFSILILSANAQLISNRNGSLNNFRFNPDINILRKLAESNEGSLPVRINVEKVAETIRPANIVVLGADSTRSMILARTVYQIEYTDKNIMLDSGMDYETHQTFGKTKEPYFPYKFELIKKALLEADLIVLTHYHADHIAGVIRSDNFDQLARKTWVSQSTADLMLRKPHKKTVIVSKHTINQLMIVPDNEYMPIAPGVVLFMAPGHTPDSKMIYIKLSDGREFIHSVDSGWSMDNIRQERMKNASWVNENENQLMDQYRWLNNLEKTNPNIIVLSSHDNVQYDRLRQNGTLGDGLSIRK